MTAPEIIEQLVRRYDDQHTTYHSSGYNESQLRLDFLNPFFEALGWDVANKQGLAHIYREVLIEQSIKIGEDRRAPDYTFRAGPAPVFYVEAKKPAVNLKDDSSPAYQLRRYAWNTKLPISVLTDFEEFAIYDCRNRPDRKDKATAGRIKYLSYREYPEKWDEIAEIFSRQAVLAGALNQYAESTKGKHGYVEVDDAFLAEIERWRDLLARNIAIRNSQLSQRELNAAVQLTIDRIIFLRICEDRGIERYEQLKDLLKAGSIYPELCLLFRQADARYNSGLFHFHDEKGQSEPADLFTPGLVVDDQPLKDIIKNIYPPTSPYEFSVMPADILGQVYERFLGKVIRLTAGHRAVVEDKPEVKKAGGVFYTPTYIVAYIVKQTVGKLLEGKQPGDKGVGKGVPMRILDMACGSGSFLLGAYQFLLDWYLKGYITEPEKWTKGRNPALVQTAVNDWRLTIAERKRILLDHIYGVDIDQQAVEVTKLSLLLKVLEGESELTVGQMSLFKERALPDLGKNIRCGNSLIGPDFHTQSSYLEPEEEYQINAFDWQKEFVDVFKSTAGFDVVIGNPPYIRMEAFKELKDYFKTKYACHDERSDLYAYFIEMAHKLLSENGRFGMIVSNKFLRANYGSPLRNVLRQTTSVERIVDFAGLPVFKGATVRTIILLTSRKVETSQPILYSPPLAIEKFMFLASGSSVVEKAIEDITYEVSADALAQNVWSFTQQDASDFLKRLKNECQSLKEYCNGQIYMGIKSGLTEAFVIDEQQRIAILQINPKAGEIIKPFLNGRDIRRYLLEPKGLFLIYTYHGIKIADFPAVEQHLLPFKERLKGRATRQEWYELQQPQYAYAKYFDGPKIVFPDIATMPRFVLDENGYYGSNTIYFIPKRDLFLLGLLNSKLAYFYFRSVCAGLEGKNETYLRFFGQYLEGFPVTTRQVESSKIQKITNLVERTLTRHQQLATANMSSEKTMLQRQIEATDREIDALVYQLYGLTAEEIKTVEGK